MFKIPNDWGPCFVLRPSDPVGHVLCRMWVELHKHMKDMPTEEIKKAEEYADRMYRYLHQVPSHTHDDCDNAAKAMVVVCVSAILEIDGSLTKKEIETLRQIAGTESATQTIN